MALQKIRIMVGRFVVVAGLTVAILVGSVAVINPADASAAKYSCSQALQLGQAWMTYGDLMRAYGAYDAANIAYAKALTYFDYC